MKQKLIILLLGCVLCTALPIFTAAQCSICAKTAAQMGEKPAAGMNSGILYLMATPFVIVGFIGYRWWKSNGRQS